MSTKQLEVEASAVQTAIYALALSLDAYFLNGIQYGVLQRATFPAFLEKTSDNLLRALANLEEQAPQAPGGSRPDVADALTALSAKCHQMVELVASLSLFRSLPIQQVRATIAQIQVLREDSVQLIQELEGCLRTPAPFYRTRSNDSTTALKEYLGSLERLFTEEWAASNANLVKLAGE